ncbi:MAG: hypothetical protein FOGNACKC_00510 [Anaerolineae bacterium]|nr:hypothetical protein [Anaerolineae bacterium]
MANEFKEKTRLNGICPYFTMFPLDFPYSVLQRYAEPEEWVLDPFCGRGTTNYASRVLGLPSIGIDSSPVAVAISEAKLANTSPKAIVKVANRILDSVKTAEIPTGEFWELAYHKTVLSLLCRLRAGLNDDCRSNARKALRAIILGALHGPQNKTIDSYFSNQSQRTYAPKPKYAVKFWKEKNFEPKPVNVLEIIKQRAERYYLEETVKAKGRIIKGDSREQSTFSQIDQNITWVLTSPPYYGMRTYVPDQWLRMWFLGGKAEVDYSMNGQIDHPSPSLFAAQLNQVWRNVGVKCQPHAQLVVRFGGVNDRKADPQEIIMTSLRNSGWEVREIVSAGFASEGRRQAVHINQAIKAPKEEYDIWAVWQGT